MRLLVDTHCWLWQLLSPVRLNAEAADLLSDPENEVFLSVASMWEIVIKHELGKLALPDPPARYIPERLGSLGYRTLSIEPAHALHVGTLPAHHKDPFDRILVAQAQVEGMTIVTADRIVTRYDIRSIWAAA